VEGLGASFKGSFLKIFLNQLMMPISPLFVFRKKYLETLKVQNPGFLEKKYLKTSKRPVVVIPEFLRRWGYIYMHPALAPDRSWGTGTPPFIRMRQGIIIFFIRRCNHINHLHGVQ
jgi:hypothetical protein